MALRFLSRSELVYPAFVLFWLNVLVFSRLCGAHDPNYSAYDLNFHVGLALKLAEKGATPPPHPLFHYCLLFLAWGGNLFVIIGMEAVLLALALSVRAYLSAFLFTSRNNPSTALSVLLCLSVALAMPLPNWWRFPLTAWPVETSHFVKAMPVRALWHFPSAVWGQVTPNVWHNPTAIFDMPFALLLFMLGLYALETPRLSTMAWVAVVTVLNLLAKPNYVLAFAPCFGVALLLVFYQKLKAGQLRALDVVGQALVAFGPALLLLRYQFLTTFGEGNVEGGKVVIAPLAAWSMLSANIPFSVLLGIAFPLSVAGFYYRQAFRDPKLVLAWAVLAVAVAQFALLQELGDRTAHGNFGWGAILADQVLFVVSCDFLLRQPPGRWRSLSFTVLGLHVATGSVCLARCLFVPPLAYFF
jgi:hypothetical protein